MKKSNGYTLVELLVLIGVVGAASIFFFVKTSYAFTDNTEEYYDNMISLALTQAEKYGENSEALKEDKVEIVTIGELVEKEYMGANEDGKVIDPRNEEKDLNSIKIKLILDEESNKVTATIEN